MISSAVALPPASSFGCLTGDAHPIPWPSLKFYALKVILNKKVSHLTFYGSCQCNDLYIP